MDSFEKLPIWQRIVVFIIVGALIVAGWFFFLYQDALDAHTGAKAALTKASAELARVEKEQENFLERQRKQAAVEAELQQEIAVLPTSKSSVDNLMQTFQQQARLVGLTVETWTPEPEQKEDFYARLPVKVRATGTWPQAGEFFRRMYELGRENKSGRIVSVDNLVLRGGKVRDRNADADGPPQLELSFEAATYRYLTEAERTASSAKGGKRRSRRRKK